MERMELYDLFEEMIEILGAQTMLGELFDALSIDELEDNLKFIADNHDLGDLYEE